MITSIKLIRVTLITVILFFILFGFNNNLEILMFLIGFILGHISGKFDNV